MTQRFYATSAGEYIGSYDGPDDDIPDMFATATEVPSAPESVPATFVDGAWVYPKVFQPIEPSPFWQAAFEMLQLKKTDILNAITDEDERYLAELDINGRKTYLRHDPMVLQLSALHGYTEQEMDSLWLYVQENYK